MAIADVDPPRGPADAQITPSTSISYWSSTPSTVDGMLGGFPQVSRIDISGSRTFLIKLLRHSNPCSSPLPTAHKVRLVADTGAGIGRITINLLAAMSQHVDIIEPIPKFTDQMRSDHPSLFTDPNSTVQNVVNLGLEAWDPFKLDPTRRYDVIWNQWCLGHLTDDALISYLGRLIPSLSRNGWIVVKENVLGNGSYGPRPRPTSTSTSKSKSKSKSTSSKRKHTRAADQANNEPSGQVFSSSTTTEDDKEQGQGQEEEEEDEEKEEEEEADLYDPLDSSVTRTPDKFGRIFDAAGLKVVKTELQRGFGRDLGLFPVRMWGLQPVDGWSKFS